MTKQAVMKFCQGCNDAQAGQHACTTKPTSMEAAIDTIKWYQHSKKAVQANQTQPSVPPEVNTKTDNPAVHGIGTSKPKKSDVEARMAMMEEQMSTLLTSLNTLTNEVRRSRRDTPRSPAYSRSPSPVRRRPENYSDAHRGYRNYPQKKAYSPSRVCYNCGKPNHLAKDCKKPRKRFSPQRKPTQLQLTSKKGQEDKPKKKDDEPQEGSSSDETSTGTTANSLGNANLLRVPIHLQGLTINALVDTGAEVTILSDTLFHTLEHKPYIIKETIMHGAGKEMSMKCRITNPVRFRIGKLSFTHGLYVAPLDCEMILGYDFMAENKVVLDVAQRQMTIAGQTVNLLQGSEKPRAAPRAFKITIPEKTVIPPQSVVRLSCAAPTQDHDFVVEPTKNTKLFIPRTVCAKGSNPEVCFVNVNDSPVTLRKGLEIAEGEKADIVAAPGNHSVNACAEGKKSDEDLKLPDHLKDMYSSSCHQLNQEQKLELKKLLIQYSDVFAKTDFDLGNFTAIEHSIDTGDAKPVKLRMRRTPLCFANEEEAHLQKMLDAGVIQPSISEWASAPVLIRKRDGGVRWCIDYRCLNSLTVKDTFPLPLIDQCLDTLADNLWFSKLDANSAYWQVKIKPSDRKKTAFITKYGLFECVKMSFGLCNAPGTYARVMNLLLRGLTWRTVLAFLDDILVLGTDFQTHLANLKEIFERFRQYQLKLKPGKCQLFRKSVEFLGRKVSKNGLQIGAQHLQPVKDWPIPTCTREIESFLGFANYHRSFIKNYAKITQPLYEITGKKPFKWNLNRQLAFEKVKKKLLTAPVLSLPNNRDYFILDTDASDKAIGAELIQIQDGKERTIAYGSLVLTPEQRRYCTTRKELLAVVRFTRQFRHYLLGRQFTVRTDHSSLTWLMGFKEPQAQLARWLEELSQYDMIIQHRPGKLHVDADSLSRIPDKVKFCPNYTADMDLTRLPCKGCSYCTRAHKNWSKFLKDVDEAVTLTKRVHKPTKLVKNIGSAMVKLFGHPENGRYDTPETTSDESEEDLGSPRGEDWLVTGIQLDVNQSGVTIMVEGEDYCQVSAITQDEGIHISGFTTEEIKSAQSEDSDLKFIMAWVQNKEEPKENELFLASPAEKSHWINRKMFFLDDKGILRSAPKKEGANTRLVVPAPMQGTVMKLCHELPSAGHQGTERTMAKIKNRYHWYNMSRDIRAFVLSCDTCSKHKKPVRYNRCQMTSYHSGYPMERVHLDFMGPLPKTKKGNEHILMMVDQFTKWVECIPLPSQTAEVTAQAAVNEFFARFGYPFQIFSDQGRNFESSLFKSICDLLQIHKARTTPYRPSANGQVERQNRSLMDAVRCFVAESQDNWDEHLPQLAGALRSSVNRSTGFTPNRLMLGRETNQPADLMFGNPQDKTYEGQDAYVIGLEKAIRLSHDIARKTLKTVQAKMKKDYDLKVLEKQYQPGDLVYVLDTAQIKGKSKKLSPPWKGPGIILTRVTPYVYKVKLQRVVFTTNHDRLKICKDRNIPSWLKECQEKVKKGEDVLTTPKAKQYCICKGPDTGEMMIQCDSCHDWFHLTCVNLTPSDTETIDKYKCPNCRSVPVAEGSS